MTADAALKEIAQQERRFEKIGFKNGLMLAKSAREYHAELLVCHDRVLAGAKAHREAKTKLAKLEAAAARAGRPGASVAEIVRLRRVVKSGERLIRKEHVARIRLDEKVKKLATMSVE